jgi:hypothetical protein
MYISLKLYIWNNHIKCYVRRPKDMLMYLRLIARDSSVGYIDCIYRSIIL